MGELVDMEAEWDLEAIVRGRSGTGTAFSAENSGGFSQFDVHQGTNLFFESETADLDELGELYKPFYPFLKQMISGEPKSFGDDKRKERKLDHLQSNGSGKDRNPETKMKKRNYNYSKKNQQTRVVKEVKEESLSSDVWAWRKYGQKPIKGSPYPRSYYRCSSSKGCLARKHVERSPTNPQIFIVTYTDEHKHGLPTRRNSLAGSTRAKPNPTKSSSTETKSGNQKVISPTSNQLITPAGEFSTPIREKGIAELNSEQTTGEFEGIVNALLPDFTSAIEFFPDFAGNFDHELLKNEEFDFDCCFLDY